MSGRARMPIVALVAAASTTMADDVVVFSLVDDGVTKDIIPWQTTSDAAAKSPV